MAGGTRKDRWSVSEVRIEMPEEVTRKRLHERLHERLYEHLQWNSYELLSYRFTLCSALFTLCMLQSSSYSVLLSATTQCTALLDRSLCLHWQVQSNWQHQPVATTGTVNRYSTHRSTLWSALCDQAALVLWWSKFGVCVSLTHSDFGEPLVFI